jgi:hypothetical protein
VHVFDTDTGERLSGLRATRQELTTSDADPAETFGRVSVVPRQFLTGRRLAVRRMPSAKVSWRAGGRSWPMPSISSSSAPGMAAAVAAAAGDVHHPVGQAVHDEGRHGQRAELGCAVGLGEDRHHLAQRAAATHAAVVGRARRRPGCAPRCPGRPATRSASRSGGSPRCSPRGRPSGPAGWEQARVLPADGPLAGRRHDAGQRPHPLRCSIAIVCAIIPPIDTPRRGADSSRGGRAAERVVGHVREEYGVRTCRRRTPGQRGPADPPGHLGGPPVSRLS